MPPTLDALFPLGAKPRLAPLPPPALAEVESVRSTLEVMDLVSGDAWDSLAMLATSGRAGVELLHAVMLMGETLGGQIAGLLWATGSFPACQGEWVRVCRQWGLSPENVPLWSRIERPDLGRQLGWVHPLRGGGGAGKLVPGRWAPGPHRGDRPLPEGLILDRLELRGLLSLTALPAEAHILETVILENLPGIEEMPSWLQAFQGDLLIRQCERLRLPEGLCARNIVLEGGAPAPPGQSGCFLGHPSLEVLPRLAATSLELSRLPALRDLWEGLKQRSEALQRQTELTLFRCHALEDLPEELEVLGALKVGRCLSFRSLGGVRQVRGDLRLEDLPALKTLPEGLTVEGNLTLKRLDGLKALPAGLWVAGDLHLELLGRLTQLPPDLRVGGNLVLLNLDQGPVLPPGLQIGGRVDQQDCARLPRRVRPRQKLA